MGSDSSDKVYDALIIGGGVSGLAAGLTLARQQHSAILLDSGVYRNASSQHIYNVLTWDQSDPADFRAAARKNILDYYTTIDFETADVVSVQETAGSGPSARQIFMASSSDGKQWRGRKLILANGVRDIFPDIHGYGDCWGKGIYHCFFCKGYEARGVESAGVLAIPDLGSVPAALHAARTAARFTKSLTIYTHGSESLKASLEEAQSQHQIFKVDSRRITQVEKGPGFSDVVLHFEDGDTVTEGFLGHKPPTEANGDLHKQLDLEMNALGDPVVKPMFYEASKRGIFVAGDEASPIKIASQALFSGSAAAAAVCAQIQAEDARQLCIF